MIFIGELAALGAAFFWSVNSIVLTEATNLVGTYAVNLGRLFFASLLLLITILLFNIQVDISSRQYVLLILSGVVGLIIGDSAMLKSYNLIGPRLTMLLMSFTPPIAALLAYIFLGEVLSIGAIIGIIVTVTGIGIVILQRKPVGEKFHFSVKGLFAGIIAASGQAGGLILVKHAFALGAINEFYAAFVRILSSVVLLLIAGQFFSKAHNPFVAFRNNTMALKYTFMGAILGPYLGITASLIALNYTYVGIASTLMATVPILMLPISKYYYKENLTGKSIIGAFIAVIGVAVIFLY